MDLSLSSLLLLVLLPFIVLIVIVLFSLTFRNPFYSQLRIGKQERIFRLYKFKTMNDLKDENGKLLPDHLRITKLGSFLRKFSLDELPQLFNVIIGDMSLVGPRPLLVKYLNYYTPIEKKRHIVHPGISGWAQVNGRSNTSWNQRLGLDVYYVEHISMKLDMLIAYKTIINSLMAKDVVLDKNKTLLDLNEERKLNSYESQNQ